MRKNKFLLSIATFSLLLFTASCSSDQESNHSSHDDQTNTAKHENSHNHQTTVNGDIREETKSTEELPTFLDNKDENITLIYAQAAEHENLLEYIPCYCGCGESVGHKNNYDCFVHEKTEEKVVWDNHGTKCQACLEIAAESIIKYEKGESIKDIRNYIDNKYSEGYANPTPTPMPS